MEYKKQIFKEAKADCQVCEKHSLLSIETDLNNARVLIQQLKADKKKLQDALRTVLAERNKKSEKLKSLGEKHRLLEEHLKKEAQFINDFHREFQEFVKDREIEKKKNQNQKSSKLKNDIATLCESAKRHIREFGMNIRHDEVMEGLIEKALKREKWDEMCLFLLQLAHRSCKRQHEFYEEDTPQFRKPKTGGKIELFLENSEALLQSLTEQQEKLQKLSKDYYDTSVKSTKHIKTESLGQNSIRILTNSESTRNIRSSLGGAGMQFSNSTTKNSHKPSLEFFSPSKKKSKAKFTD